MSRLMPNAVTATPAADHMQALPGAVVAPALTLVPPVPPQDMPYDLNACRALMRGGSKTFFAASLLLPTRVRAPASALYAYCRLADDAIDEGSNPHLAMAMLQNRLDAIYAGRPGSEDADRALCQVVHRYAIPRELLDALLEGFLWDAQGRRYETLADVMDYGARVAGTVGAMMALVMGAQSPQALARACELGVAMQLTNIARDVGEDARNGRLYLPRAWLREAGVDINSWLQHPNFSPAIAQVTQRLLAAAETLYERAEQGIAELPRDCRPAIQAARLVYAEIGHQLQRDGLDSISQRTVVARRRKLALIARATGAAVMAPAEPQRGLEPLPAIDFLVQAANVSLALRNNTNDTSTNTPAREHKPKRSFDERMAWAADLHVRLVEKDDMQARLTSFSRT
jgi:15-cis-phytoene synthase